jgi:chromate reductase
LKKIFVIIGSASHESANKRLVEYIQKISASEFEFDILHDLKSLPHFDPESSLENPPQIVKEIRTATEKADGVLFCTPEYVFSIPSGLKNLIEWCVATTVFSDKPIGIITASADGTKGHEELQLIMKTIVAKFNESTTLLIRGIKSKVNEKGEITDKQTAEQVDAFIEAFRELIQAD